MGISKKILEELQIFVDDNSDGRTAEELAKQFGVPDSVAAFRMMDLKLEEIRKENLEELEPQERTKRPKAML